MRTVPHRAARSLPLQSGRVLFVGGRPHAGRADARADRHAHVGGFGRLPAVRSPPRPVGRRGLGAQIAAEPARVGAIAGCPWLRRHPCSRPDRCGEREPGLRPGRRRPRLLARRRALRPAIGSVPHRSRGGRRRELDLWDRIYPQDDGRRRPVGGGLSGVPGQSRPRLRGRPGLRLPVRVGAHGIELGRPCRRVPTEPRCRPDWLPVPRHHAPCDGGDHRGLRDPRFDRRLDEFRGIRPSRDESSAGGSRRGLRAPAPWLRDESWGDPPPCLATACSPGRAVARLGPHVGRDDQGRHLRDRPVRARHPRPGTRVVGPARPRHRRDLGGARGALCADGARPEAPARLPQHREHRDHPDRRGDRAPRKRGRCDGPRERGAHRGPVPYPQPRPVQVGPVPGVRLHPVGRRVARPQRPRWAGPGDAGHRPRVRHRRRGDQRPAAAQWLRQRVADVPGPDRRGCRWRAVSRRPARLPSWPSAVSG